MIYPCLQNLTGKLCSQIVFYININAINIKFKDKFRIHRNIRDSVIGTEKVRQLQQEKIEKDARDAAEKEKIAKKEVFCKNLVLERVDVTFCNC